jgi:hypothetical protein
MPGSGHCRYDRLLTCGRAQEPHYECFWARLICTYHLSPYSALTDMIVLYQSTLKVIRHSMQTEGAAFMFKGWLPAWSRLQPTTILIFITLEQLKNAVDWGRDKGFTL